MLATINEEQFRTLVRWFSRSYWPGVVAIRAKAKEEGG